LVGQSQCKPNAESSLFAEVQPDLTKFLAKLANFFHIPKSSQGLRRKFSLLFQILGKDTKKKRKSKILTNNTWL